MVDAPAEVELVSCPDCGKEGINGANGLRGHWNLQCPKNPKAAVAKKRSEKTQRERAEEARNPVQSKRGQERRGFSERPPTTLEQIRTRPGGLTGGPAAYFINPRGATIREVLIIYPNGAPVMRRGREVGGATYAQQRQIEKGYEYVGPTLTRDGAKRLIQVIEANKEDYLLDLSEQFTDCEHDIENSDNPAWRDNQRKRRNQVSRLIEIAEQPLDADALFNELAEIVQAHKLAALDPNLREVIAEIAGDVANARILAMVGQMEGGKKVAGDGGSVVTSSTKPDWAQSEEF